MDRFPYPFIQMNPQDMAELKVKDGDLVEVYNDNGSTQAVVYPTPTAKRKQTFMLFAYPTGVQGNVVSPGVNEFVIPELQADLGRDPQDRRRAGRRAASDVQVGGILDVAMRVRGHYPFLEVTPPPEMVRQSRLRPVAA